MLTSYSPDKSRQVQTDGHLDQCMHKGMHAHTPKCHCDNCLPHCKTALQEEQSNPVPDNTCFMIMWTKCLGNNVQNRSNAGYQG